MVVCEPNPAGDTFRDRPTVIVEVIFEATGRTDEGEKRDAHLTIPTLTAYLLIETASPRVVVHHGTEGGFTARQYDGLAAAVPLEGLGELSLPELYERVDFTTAEPEDASEE